MTTDHTPPTDQTTEIERLRTKNERMRHELKVMYGGAFDTPPANQAALRNRIIEALLAPRYGAPQHNTPGGLRLTATPEEARHHRAGQIADIVLAVLPPPTDRAAFQVRAIDLLARARDIHRETCILARGDVQPSAYRCGMCEVLNAPAVEPPADRATLRDRIRHALCKADGFGFAWGTDLLEPDEYGDAADAVLAELPPPVSRADVLRGAADAIDAETRQAKADGVLEPDKYRPCRDASAQLRRMADEAQRGTEAHSCGNCEGVDLDTCLMNPNRPPEQCPRSEFDGYGQQCQKPAGHNLCTFEEQHAAGASSAPEVKPCPPGCIACATDESHDPAPAAGARQDGAQP